MRSRRNIDRGLLAHAAGAARALIWRLWIKATRRPVDSLALFAAGAASFVIIVNAVFLQSGSRSAPFLANSNPGRTVGRDEHGARDTTIAARWPTGATPQSVAVRRVDPIADLIGPSPRIAAVQHILSDYGYGQIKQTGILDEATSTAIEKFQREHKLTVTGEVSGRLIGELAAMVGHPLQ